MKHRPQLSFWQIWNMCFGFLGIQFGFALQNANVSRIFQTLGAEIDDLPILWVAAPVTGLIVQPIIGHMKSDTRMGRCFLRGLAGDAMNAILAAAGLNLRKLLRGFLFRVIFWLTGRLATQISAPNGHQPTPAPA